MERLIFEGTASISGKWLEDGDLRELWVGDDEIIETIEKYEGKKIKITIEVE